MRKVGEDEVEIVGTTIGKELGRGDDGTDEGTRFDLAEGVVAASPDDYFEFFGYAEFLLDDAEF